MFYSTHDAIKADNVCMETGIQAGLIPTHPSITLGCGFMLKADWTRFSDTVKVLEERDVKYKALYYSIRKGIKRETELLYEDYQ